MAYEVVDDFRGGYDTRKSILTSPPGTLQKIVNAHINRGGEIEKRKAFAEMADLPANSFGFHSVNGSRYVFGSVAADALSPALPAGVNYQRLVHPAGSSDMDELMWADNFDGKIYAIAKFEDGNVYHYFDGARVTTWDTVAGSVASNSNVASSLAARIDLDSAYSAVAVGSVLTITAATPGTSFTYEAETRNGGTNADQSITLAQTVANVAAAAEVLASSSFTVTGGTASAGTNKITSVKVDGVEILTTAVDWITSHTVTAANIAAQINTTASTPEYTATSNGPVVTISPAAGTGARVNGYAVTTTVGGNLTTSTPSAMAGGVNAVAAVAQVVTATIGGTFEAADQFTITLDGKDFVVSGAASGTAVTARTLKQKMYATTQSLLYFPALGNPNQWGSGVGSGFHNMSTQDGGSDVLTATGIYQGNLAVFSKRAVQIWLVDEDPANNRPLQTLPNIGTNAPKSVTSIGETDVFFLALSGVRSLRARDSSNNAFVYDIGTPIDEPLKEYLGTLTETQRANAVGVIEPKDGRYWLAVGDRVYAFSFFPSSKVSAWSTYEPGLEFTHWAIVDDRVWGRAGNKMYLYGGADGDTYDDAEVEIILPWVSAKTPATMKEVTGIDIALQGEWDIYVGTAPDAPTEYTLAHTVDRASFTLGRLPNVGQTTHVGLKLKHQKAEAAKISGVMVHYIPEEAA